MSYENINGGDSLRFNLGNWDIIKYFVLSVYGQDGSTIQDIGDYFMHIQFIIYVILCIYETKILLNKAIEYNRYNDIIFIFYIW